jgi:hypothetical protein
MSLKYGFVAGWNQVMGIWTCGGGDPREGESTLASEQPKGLVDFDGDTVGPTAI